MSKARAAVTVQAVEEEAFECDLHPPVSFEELVAAQRAFLASLPDGFVDVDLDSGPLSREPGLLDSLRLPRLVDCLTIAVNQC